MSERTEWQPIATAPKDGTEVFIFAPRWGSPIQARFMSGKWKTHILYHALHINTYQEFDYDATHWLPLSVLPAPPKEQP